MSDPHDDNADNAGLRASAWRRGALGAFAIVAVVAAANGFTRLVDRSGPPEPQVAVGLELPTTAPTAQVVPQPSTDCDVQAAREEIGPVDALGNINPLQSPTELGEQNVMVRGQLILLPGGLNGDRIAHAKVRDAIGADGVNLAAGLELRLTGAAAVPNVVPPSGEVISLNFVAFTTPAWAVHPEGLWIGCGWDTPALPGLMAPQQPAWQDLMAGGVTLDEIWKAAEPSPRERDLSTALLSGDGTAVFDVALDAGERLRISVPEAMAEGLTKLTEIRASDGGGVSLKGPAGGLAVGFGFCELSPQLEQQMRMNALGSDVAIDGPTVRICRPDEMVSATFLMADPAGVTLSDEALDAFDVRVISSGSSHRRALVDVWPNLANCGNCAPWGPMVFPDAGVVVNRTGMTRVSAVSVEDLSQVWSRDVGGFEVALHGGPGAGVFVDALGGEFLRLDPLTGETVWQLQRDVDERDADFSRHRDDTWILRSSFAVAGDDRAPILRSIDPASGEVRWQAEGRSASAWQWTRPVVLNGVAVMMDVSDFTEAAVRPSATLRGYDLDTGELRWATELNSGTEAYNTGLVAVFDFEIGRVLFAITIEGDVLRVDPVTGAIAWRTTVGPAQFNGTALGPNGDLVLDLDVRGRQVLVDPITGKPVG